MWHNFAKVLIVDFVFVYMLSRIDGNSDAALDSRQKNTSQVSSWEVSFLRILYADPCIQPLSALKIPIKIYEDTKICKLDDHYE